MGCDDGLCLPKGMMNGFAGSPYFWYILVITAIAGLIVYWILSKPNWFVRTFFAPLYPGSNAFIWIYSVMYFLLLLATLVCAWNPRDPNSRCILIVYTLLLILTVGWILAIREKQFEWSYTILAFLMLMTIWLIWLTNPQRCGNYFIFVIAILYLLSLIVGIYFNYKLATQNIKSNKDEKSSESDSK